MQAMLSQISKLQQQAEDTQREIEEAEFTGTSGGGAVVATVAGSGELKAITIDPKVIDPEEAELLGDLVVAAVRDASAQAAKLAEEKRAQLTSGLGLGGLGLPGM
ncbi:YbaB/EbfC family nucleoid-associated protein [Actinokineospora bangkokensis]|uniref:Nucleoid-associated protein BJP25_01120 n=1 Tax=Actinokineospora bangkokensis TaxID=1193682 RepID=A0A1Q9LCC7_9PSEU|nr:YbaB/EbfC family nucleoid-associated protein [Actinokineospora bangkokensis]OLR89669.1 nucleoid-associated protein, YbaB/EbfC family [Actinokineospora bangkokensis]